LRKPWQKSGIKTAHSVTKLAKYFCQAWIKELLPV